ncbi:hypothetical protein BRADI_1g46846v3 [Brachypodium distachyon]|uniref:Uncharacterized protein n=1 Tax=Brachypodium distachyon TaxID=15368 RepID=A0A2K2DPT4_BRADI|nr:hypothetical protein BRADI_1g46846v3 [Brachypodium distachyon]
MSDRRYGTAVTPQKVFCHNISTNKFRRHHKHFVHFFLESVTGIWQSLFLCIICSISKFYWWPCHFIKKTKSLEAECNSIFLSHIRLSSFVTGLTKGFTSCNTTKYFSGTHNDNQKS